MLQLDFFVDINQKAESLDISSDPNISINYSVTIETSVPSTSSGTIPDGREFASTYFSPSLLPPTQFTAEVLSNITETLNPFSTSTGIYREFSVNGYGSGQPETFEAIFLTTDASSTISETTNTWTSYQRGLQRQMVIGSGNSVTAFDGASFQAYMESLIGDSNFFYFGDYYIVSEFFPDTNSSMTIDQYGYFGNATLINVSAVPAPVVIDIKPGSDPNDVNPKKKKKIPVAVLGSTDFDATQIDFSTVTFGPDGATPVHDGHVKDVNRDGFMDMVFHFNTQETGIVCGDTEATLMGETFGETQFTGNDAVTTVGCK
jgi:hypothetical protein